MQAKFEKLAAEKKAAKAAGAANNDSKAPGAQEEGLPELSVNGNGTDKSTSPAPALDVPKLVTTVIEEKESEEQASAEAKDKPAKPTDLPVTPVIVCQSEEEEETAPKDEVDAPVSKPVSKASSTENLEEAFPSLPAPRGPSIFASSPAKEKVGVVSNVKKDLQIAAEAAVATVQEL